MRKTPVILTAVALAACKPPPEEENLTLAETYPLLFSDFEQGCDRLAELVAVVEEGIADIDLTSENLDDRARSLDPLQFEGLDVTTPPGTDPANQTPVVLFGQSRHDFQTNVEVALEPNQVCIESDSTVFYDRTYTEGPDCVIDGSCEVARSSNEVRKELSIIASGWYDVFADFRRCELPDGREFLAERAWTEEVFPADKENQSFSQSFVAQLWIEDGDVTTRLYAIWPEIVIGLGPDAMRALVRNSLEEGYENADAFGDDAGFDYCPNDRDEVFTRE